MKKIISIIFVLLFSSHIAIACGGEKPKLNSISFNVLGTGSYVGFSYERLIKERLTLEVGVGILGIGAGATVYPFKAVNIYFRGFNPYIGIKTTFNSKLSGGEKNMTYIPFGVTYFTRSRLAFGIDIGPSYQTNYSPFGKVTPEHASTFPNASFMAYGNFKVSYRF